MTTLEYPDFPHTRHKPRWDTLHQGLHQEVRLYVNHGIQPSNFFALVITDQPLSMCIRAADPINRILLVETCAFVLDCFPHRSFGSREHMEYWIKNGGWQGLYNPDYSL